MKTVETIAVEILAPEGVLFKDEVLSLSSENGEGAFDLLPDHARFMTLLEKVSVLLILHNGSEKKIPIEHAVLCFSDGVAKIYVHTTSMMTAT
jgi:F0F1-type ATP synthase epsilon subunit